MSQPSFHTPPGALVRDLLPTVYATNYIWKEQSSMSITSDTSCRVLIVEDDESIMTMIQLLLELRGYAAAIAPHGAAAVEYLRETSTLPAVIVLDLQMPIMDGCAFLEVQHGNPAWSAIPVILMSAISDTTAVQQQFDVQASIRKPFDPAQLLDLVDRFCA
jgi:CheY-like chemotaxis protein